MFYSRELSGEEFVNVELVQISEPVTKYSLHNNEYTTAYFLRKDGKRMYLHARPGSRIGEPRLVKIGVNYLVDLIIKNEDLGPMFDVEEFFHTMPKRRDKGAEAFLASLG